MGGCGGGGGRGLCGPQKPIVLRRACTMSRLHLSTVVAAGAGFKPQNNGEDQQIFYQCIILN